MARRGLSLVVSWAILASLAAPGTAQTRQRRELARIQSDLRRTLEELDQLRAAETALSQDVGRLRTLDADSRRRVETLQLGIRRAEARRAELRSRLDAAGKVSGVWAGALSAETARLAAWEASRADFSGTGDLWAEEFRRDAILEKARHLRSLSGFQRRTEMAAADARRRADELARNSRRAKTEMDDRRKQYESKKAELERTQSRVAEAARRAQELEENRKALNALIERLSKAARRRPAPGVPASLDIPRHSLPWPVRGRVVRGFGREKDPDLGTWTVHQGVMFSADPSAAVSAVAAGKVIYAGSFRSYGQVVILDHDHGFFSVYGRLGAILKDKGAAAAAGEAIGRAGAAAGGAVRVYLELRRGTEALDPMVWLRKREREK